MELKLNNGNAHYYAIGEGIPLLTLGGRTTDYRYMMGLMEPLFQERSGWQRIYMDPPGHGKTQVDENVDSYDMVLDFIIDFVDTLLEGRAFVIAGQSLGSTLSMGVVHKIPEQVDGCCLIACGDVWWDYRPRTLLLPDQVVLEGDSDFMAGIKTGHKWLANIVVAQSNRGLTKLYDDWLSAGYPLYDAKLWDLIKERGGFSFDVNNLAESFERPTLILTGRQDSMDGYEIPWDTFNMFPRATLAVLDKAGHLVGWAEQESLTKTLIVEWLNRVEADIHARSLSS
jgi:pimeloyl-ACP methyl ester carboxylesterase